MKRILRSIIFESFSLYFLSILFSGIRFSGGIFGIVISGAILSILMFIFRPLFGILLFPLNIITFGILGFINYVWSNAIILYILTLISKYISLHGFTMKKITASSIMLPSVTFNSFFAFLIVALVYSIFKKIFEWIVRYE